MIVITRSCFEQTLFNIYPVTEGRFLLVMFITLEKHTVNVTYRYVVTAQFNLTNLSLYLQSL